MQLLTRIDDMFGAKHGEAKKFVAPLVIIGAYILFNLFLMYQVNNNPNRVPLSEIIPAEKSDVCQCECQVRKN